MELVILIAIIVILIYLPSTTSFQNSANVAECGDDVAVGAVVVVVVGGGVFFFCFLLRLELLLLLLLLLSSLSAVDCCWVNAWTSEYQIGCKEGRL